MWVTACEPQDLGLELHLELIHSVGIGTAETVSADDGIMDTVCRRRPDRWTAKRRPQRTPLYWTILLLLLRFLFLLRRSVGEMQGQWRSGLGLHLSKSR